MVLGDGAFGRCSGHKGRALMYGISAFIKEAPKLPCPFYPMWMQQNKQTNQPSMNQKEGPLPNYAGTWISDFQAAGH